MYLSRKQLEKALELLTEKIEEGPPVWSNAGVYLDEESKHKLTPVRMQTSFVRGHMSGYTTYLMDHQGVVVHDYDTGPSF